MYPAYMHDTHVYVCVQVFQYTYKQMHRDRQTSTNLYIPTHRPLDRDIDTYTQTYITVKR